MQKIESVLQRESHKILFDFETQTTQSGLENQNNKKEKRKKEILLYSGLCHHTGWHVLRPCQRTKKAVEHEGNGDTNCNLHACYGLQKLGRGTERIGNQRTNWEQPKYRIVEIGQHTEMSPGDLRRYAAIQTPMKDHQLTMVWITH